MVETCSCDAHLDRGKLNAALKLLRSHPDYVRAVEVHGKEVADGMLAIEIPRRADLYRQRWPGMELTPTALAHNWARLLTPVKGPHGVSADDLYRQAEEARRREQLRSD